VGWMQGEQLPLTGEQGRVFLLTSPLIGFPNWRQTDPNQVSDRSRAILEVMAGAGDISPS
jgi:hypothetical protein